MRKLGMDPKFADIWAGFPKHSVMEQTQICIILLSMLHNNFFLDLNLNIGANKKMVRDQVKEEISRMPQFIQTLHASNDSEVCLDYLYQITLGFKHLMEAPNKQRGKQVQTPAPERPAPELITPEPTTADVTAPAPAEIITNQPGSLTNSTIVVEHEDPRKRGFFEVSVFARDAAAWRGQTINVQNLDYRKWTGALGAQCEFNSYNQRLEYTIIMGDQPITIPVKCEAQLKIALVQMQRGGDVKFKVTDKVDEEPELRSLKRRARRGEDSDL